MFGKYYNVICILNDYMHIVKYHDNILEDIHKHISVKIMCNLEHCGCIQRNFRNRISCDTKHIKNTNNKNDIGILISDIIDVIHCYILHTFNIGFKLTLTEKQMIYIDDDDDDYKDDNHLNVINVLNLNKFNIANMSSTDIDNDDKKSDSTGSGSTVKIEYGFLALKSILKGKRIAYKNIMGAFDRIIYTKLITKMSNKNLLDKYNNESNNEQNKEKQLISFTMFNNFYYWKEYKNKQDLDLKNPGYKYCDLYIVPVYTHFKDEILNNEIFKLIKNGINTWNTIRFKSEIYLKTVEFKTNYKSKEWNYGIPKNAPLNIEYIIALILYCDFTKLSSKLAETYVPKNCEDTLIEIKKRHQNYYWFAKHLTIVVELFGTQFNENCYYHSINVPVAFHSTICRFNHLYSMTSSIEVASNFSVNNGILLKLKSYNEFNNKHNYFNLNLISSFTFEYEKLFVGYDNNINLQINDIILCSNGNKYYEYLSALNVFTLAMNGESTTSMNVCKKNKKIIKSIIGGKIHKFDKYFLSILNKYKSTKQIVIIDLYLMKKKHVYSFMSAYFLSSSTSSSLKYVIKFHVLSNLFKNLQKIIITNGSGHNHNHIIISQHYLTYILSSLLSLIPNSFQKLKQIKMRNVKCINNIKIKDVIHQFIPKYELQIGFDIYCEKILFQGTDYYTLFIVKIKNSSSDQHDNYTKQIN